MERYSLAKSVHGVAQAVAAGIPACRRAGHLCPAGKASLAAKTPNIFHGLLAFHGRAGRQGCRPLRQARMPDATWRRHPACRRAGHLCPVGQAPLASQGVEHFPRFARLRSRAGRQGCRPLRQARMPDATWRQAAWPALISHDPIKLLRVIGGGISKCGHGLRG